MKAEHRQGWLFVSPWVIGFLLLTAGPMVYSLYLSFTASSLSASLELVKEGEMNIRQAEAFAALYLKRRAIGQALELTP